MKNLSLILLLAGGVVLFDPAASTQADQGQALFKKKMCFACHGAGKKGGDLAASKMDKAAMIAFLKNPKAANPKAAAMPASKGTDAELSALVDYVMTLRK